MLRRPRPESGRDCELCRVRLEWRRPRRVGLPFGAGVFAVLLCGTLVLPGWSGDGLSLGLSVLAPVLAILSVQILTLVLHLALGGGDPTFRPWEICPRCADFRLPDDRFRRLIRIERLFDRLRWYLLVPACFFFLLSIFRTDQLWTAVALFLGATEAEALRHLRPRRPDGQTGVRIPEEVA